jgi:hypothetical protein
VSNITSISSLIAPLKPADPSGAISAIDSALWPRSFAKNLTESPQRSAKTLVQMPFWHQLHG